MNYLKLILISLFMLLFISGCSSKTTQIYSKITSNVDKVKIYGGLKKSKLSYYCTTPCYKPFSAVKPYYRAYYYEARKAGYKSQLIYRKKTPYFANRIIHFNMGDSKEKKRKALDELNVSVYEKENNLKKLKTYIEANPKALFYVKNQELKLLLTGPQGMKVADIKKLINKKRKEVIIISLIKRVKTPYKEYTLKEIDILLDMGISENIIASMIDVTTKLKEKEEEKELANKKTKSNTKVIYKTKVIEKKENTLGNEIQKELIKQGAKQLFKQLF